MLSMIVNSSFLGKLKDHFIPKIIHLSSTCEYNKGNLLLSYITKPFELIEGSSIFNIHTNYWECLQIANIWRAFGYAVDVIDYNDSNFIPRKDYSIFIDIHSNMERLTPYLGEDCKKILHITGAHWLYQNEAEYARLLSLQRRRGITLSPRRLAQPSLGIEFADCATILGNEFTMSTFEYARKPLYRIPISAAAMHPCFEDKDYGKCRKNFLWFGGSGLVLKGLDLTLEAFSQMPEYNLTVCGPVDKEGDFERAYWNELYRTPNIKTAGWVDATSSTFTDILKNNLGLVYPSASEGQAGSVVQCLHGGLIPIISFSSGVDIDGFGTVLHECSIEEIKSCVKEISALPIKDLRSMSRMTWDYANANHTRERFAKAYSQFASTMLKNYRLQ